MRPMRRIFSSKRRPIHPTWYQNARHLRRRENYPSFTALISGFWDDRRSLVTKWRRTPIKTITTESGTRTQSRICVSSIRSFDILMRLCCLRAQATTRNFAPKLDEQFHFAHSSPLPASRPLCPDRESVRGHWEVPSLVTTSVVWRSNQSAWLTQYIYLSIYQYFIIYISNYLFISLSHTIVYFTSLIVVI